MKLHHQIVGAGPPLIILHGLLGSLDNWVPHAKVLAGNFQVCLLDLRNHGHSPHHAEFNYEVLAADVAEFIQQQKLGPVRLLGHSMGGKVAMRFAQLHPDLTRGLVIADMAPREYPSRYASILDAMHALDLTQFHQRSEVETALAAVAPEKGIRQFLLKNLGRDETGKLRWKPNVAALRANYHQVRSGLPPESRYDGPTLFVRGGNSDYIRDADVALIQQIFPQAEVQTLAGVGHWLHAEAPEQFIQIISNFLCAET